MMKRFAFAVLLAAILATSYSADTTINVCEDVASGIFLADLTDCHKYTTCYNGQAYPNQTCQNDLFFNAKNQSCEESDSECIQQCGEALSSFAYDKTCTKYVLCYDDTPILRECLDGLQYDSETNRCDFAYLVDCQANMCTANDVNNIQFLPSHANCSKYFICYDGVAVPKYCAPGLYFNEEKGECDYPKNVVCNISTTRRRAVSSAKQPPVRASITCPTEGTHFYPNEEDETSYFFCVNGNGVKLSCSPDLIYDKKTESCRIPTKVRK